MDCPKGIAMLCYHEIKKKNKNKTHLCHSESWGNKT